jgi:chromosome segregation ATPase
MSNQRLPNEEEIQKVGDLQESHDQGNIQELRKDLLTTSTRPTETQEKTAEYKVTSSSEVNEEKSSPPSYATEQGSDESVAHEDKLADNNQQITELDVAKKQEQQQLVPTMSHEQVLLLQVLRRAKRQQELIIEVQRNLKLLTYIQKEMEKTREQVKQLQSAVKDSQKQFMQIERQLSVIRRGQEKGFEKLRTRKIGAALLSNTGKVAEGRRRQKKSK